MKLVIGLTILLFFRFALVHGATTTTKHYIVYMGDHSHPNTESVILANQEMLGSVIGSIDGAQQATIHHYSKSFRGFSALLSPDQAQQLAENESVVSVFESKINHVHTTHSWEFLGVDSIQQYNQLTGESKSDVIVGVIDTGVWPESKSFNDIGLGPVPKRFKGECVTGDHFTLANCNRKLIGARFYSKGFEAENGPLESSNLTFFRSVRDTDGHGSHTASTVAGSVVANVSLFGMATGTARGGAPSARLAIYKACWFNLCSDADLLSAFDDATNDGVDIISISAGPNPPQPSFFDDANSIGAFHAFRKGILVSASAGNSGLPGTAANVAPWILTVAASSVDREFISNVYLGNSKTLKGFSLNPLKMERSYGVIAASVAAAPGVPSKNARYDVHVRWLTQLVHYYPLERPDSVACKSHHVGSFNLFQTMYMNSDDAANGLGTIKCFCKNNTLDHTLIKGKIVVCTIETITDNRNEKSIFVRQGGGVGMILIDPLAKEVGFQFVIPATIIGQKEAQELETYLATEKNPIAKISPTRTVLNTRPAPKIALFSSVGPNIITPDIIKPDITAPGLNILAAWSPLATEATAERSVNFNIISGTSMSCPHVSAVAAIIKSSYPSWSPAAIKSAIMTTATGLDNTQGPILRDPFGSQASPFDYGSGHLNPLAAVDPGLVYDFDSYDIIDFLCSNGAGPAQIEKLTGKPVTCKNPPIPSYNLNYPSIGVANMNGRVSVHRTVTYYGKGATVFVAHIEYPAGVKIVVTPYKLKFRYYGEKMTFRVDFIPYKNSNGSFVFGALTWSNGVHRVRSPIGLNVLSV